MITASPGMIIAGAASALLVVLAARGLHTFGGGWLVCYRVGISTGIVALATIPSHVPDGMRGRAFRGSSLIWRSVRLTSLLLGRLLADAVGIRAVYYLGGVLLATARAWPILR